MSGQRNLKILKQYHAVQKSYCENCSSVATPDERTKAPLKRSIRTRLTIPNANSTAGGLSVFVISGILRIAASLFILLSGQIKQSRFDTAIKKTNRDLCVLLSTW